MKKPKARRALAYLLSVTLVLGTLPTSAFAEQLSDIVQDAQAQNPAAPSDGGDDSNPVPLSPTLPAPTDDAEANDEVDASANQPEAQTPQVEPQAAAAAQSVAVSGSTYAVETNDDLAQALTAIVSSSDDAATIELKGGETFGSVRPELTFSTFSSRDDNAREQFELLPGISLFRWFERGQNRQSTLV